MEKKIIILAVIALILLGGVLLMTNQTSTKSEYLSALEKKEISVGSQKLSVWIADTPALQQHGLMSVTHMADTEGMLFVFNSNSVKSFWNKNTLLDLDIVWVAGDRVVGVSALSNEPAHGIVYVESPTAVDAALEVNEGWAARHGVKVGDAVAKK